MRLRDYQNELKQQTYAAWQDPAVRNVMATCATGGGKTVFFCSVIDDLNEPAVLLAHRQELVAQASLTLNRERIPHDIIAPAKVIQQIIGLHLLWHGHTCYRVGANVRVAGVDTLVARTPDPWFQRVRLVIIDEAHHVLASNKWGKAMAMFPHARGLFVTAHALRLDGKGLGRGQGGLADALIIGPSAYELMQRGYLCTYHLAGVGSDIDISAVHETQSGELNEEEYRAAWHSSKTIVGDIAKHYVHFAGGELGLTFAADIEGCGEIIGAYKKLDVHAALITGETPIDVRGKIMQKFRDADILQLVSVDVLGEGTDVPAVVSVSLARHTNSFQRYAQYMGRMMRPMIGNSIFEHWDTYTDAQRLAFIASSKKPRGIAIDHVDNWDRHLPLPEMPRPYTLDKRERGAKKKKSDAIPLRRCLNLECRQPYERVLAQCPLCGTVPPLMGRGSPQHVDGDLSLFDDETMRALQGLVAKRDAATPDIPRGADPVVVIGIHNRHARAKDAQSALRATILLWSGWQQKHLGRDETETYKRFYFEFGGVDVLTAQSLNAQDAATLESKIRAKLDAANIVEA